MKVKCYVLIHEKTEGYEQRSIEMVFKKLEEAEEYLKNMITEILLETSEYEKGIEDEEFKRDYEDEENYYSIEEWELR